MILADCAHIAIALVFLCAIILPLGRVCRRAIAFGSTDNKTSPLDICWDWLLGSAAICALESLQFFLPAAIMHALAWLVLIACLCQVALVVRRANLQTPLSTRRERVAKSIPLVLLGSLVIVFSIGFAGVPYPGPLGAGYGDMPSYYRVAQNLASSHLPYFDFRFGDFPNETYPLPLGYPLPTLIAAFFLHYFPDSHVVLELYCLLCSAFCLVAIAWPNDDKASNSTSHTLRILLAYAIFTGTSTVLHIALGAVTWPTALFFTLLLQQLVSKAKPSGARGVAILVGLLALYISRPEGAVLAGLLLLAIAGFVFDMLPRIAKFGGIAAIASMGILIAEKFQDFQFPSGFCLRYITYDQTKESFVSPYFQYWWQVNWHLAFESVGMSSASFGNTRALQEIVMQPFAFAKFLAVDCVLQLGWPFVLSFTGSGLALYALCGKSTAARRSVLICLAFIPLVAAFNPAFRLRHCLPVIAGLAFLALWRMTGAVNFMQRASKPIEYGLLVALCLIASYGSLSAFHEATGLRKIYESVAFAPILKELEHLVAPGERIATSYPPLVSMILDRPTVGNTALIYTLPKLVAKYKPEYILLDHARDGAMNYHLYKQWYLDKGNSLPGYEVRIHQQQAPEWILLGRK